MGEVSAEEIDKTGAKPAPPKAAADKIMPFGSTKGKRLGDLHDEELEQAIAWCRKADAKKFESLIGALEEVLAARAVRGSVFDGAGELEETDDDLPF